MFAKPFAHSGVPSPRKNGETAQDGMTDGREAKEERLAVYYCGKSTRGAPFCKTDGHAKKGRLGGRPGLFDKVSRLRLRHFSWERRF